MRSYPALRITSAAAPGDFIDLVAAVLDDYGIIAIEETSTGAIVAYLADGGLRSAAAAALRREYASARVEEVDVSDENWAARSQAALKAITAGDVTVAPPWDVPADSRSIIITILPSMGFGTGHHATTRLCLEALQAIALTGRSLLDVGTGSGVLAITAAKLGASRVLAIDNDEDAVANAVENAALNHTAIEIRCASIEAPDLAAAGPFDAVVANLTGATLNRFAPALISLLRADGDLIVSGLREEEEEAVRNAFQTFGSVTRREEGGWICLRLRRSQA